MLRVANKAIMPSIVILNVIKQSVVAPRELPRQESAFSGWSVEDVRRWKMSERFVDGAGCIPGKRGGRFRCCRHHWKLPVVSVKDRLLLSPISAMKYAAAFLTNFCGYSYICNKGRIPQCPYSQDRMACLFCGSVCIASCISQIFTNVLKFTSVSPCFQQP